MPRNLKKKSEKNKSPSLSQSKRKKKSNGKEEEIQTETSTTEITQELDPCGICLEKIENRGILNCCKHCFCFVCIKKWSETSNTCPICKRRFRNISKQINGKSQKHAVRHTERRNRPTSFELHSSNGNPFHNLNSFNFLLEFFQAERFFSLPFSLPFSLTHFPFDDSDDQESDFLANNASTITTDDGNSNSNSNGNIRGATSILPIPTDNVNNNNSNTFRTNTYDFIDLTSENEASLTEQNKSTVIEILDD